MGTISDDDSVQICVTPNKGIRIIIEEDDDCEDETQSGFIKYEDIEEHHDFKYDTQKGVHKDIIEHGGERSSGRNQSNKTKPLSLYEGSLSEDDNKELYDIFTKLLLVFLPRVKMK